MMQAELHPLYFLQISSRRSYQQGMTWGPLIGLLDTLGFERQTSRPTTRSSPSRLSKIFLRLPLTLDVSDFSLERLTLSRGGMCRHRYGRQRRCFQGANLEGSATTSSSAFWRTLAASGRAPRGILVRVFLLILLIVAKSCFALIAGTTGKIGGNNGVDREADDDADDDDEEEDEYAATKLVAITASIGRQMTMQTTTTKRRTNTLLHASDADWEEDAGASGGCGGGRSKEHS